MPAGLAFGSQLTKSVCWMKPITLITWGVLKLPAAGVEHIWDMYLMMDQSQRVCGIASIQYHSFLRRGTEDLIEV